MRLTLRPEWKAQWPLTSFCGYDLKTGVTVVLLFAILNKVSGFYGIISVLEGAGGTFAQYTLYIYSTLALVGLIWGLKIAQQEDAKYTLYLSHLFFADHIVSTAWTVFFAVVWWVYTPHDGTRQANSEAQKEMMQHGSSSNMTDAERAAAAMDVWKSEKNTAAAIIIISWTSKFYFALILYSFAIHLRKGTYRNLPLSRSAHGTTRSGAPYEALAEDDDEIEDFYRVPTRNSQGGGNSISSFSDFITAPGRSSRRSHSKSGQFVPNQPARANGEGAPREVIFEANGESSGGVR